MLNAEALAVGTVKSEHQTTDNGDVRQANLALFRYCDQFLRQIEDGTFHLFYFIFIIVFICEK